MDEPVPLSLGLNPYSVPACLEGSAANLMWWVRNNSAGNLANLRVLLEKTHADDGTSIPDLVDAGVPLRAGEHGWLNTPLNVSISGCYAVRVRVEARYSDGRRLCCVSREPVHLPALVLPQDQGWIEVDAEDKAQAGIYRPSATSKVKVKLRGSSTGLVHRPGEEMANGGKDRWRNTDNVDLDELIAVALRPVALDGLYDLNFERIVATWPQKQHLKICVVNAQGEPAATGKCGLEHKYALRLDTFGKPGHVTLIAKGDEDMHYLLAPLSGAKDVPSPAVAAGRAWFPRDERRPGRTIMLFYPQAGLERVLALVTPEPLLPFARVAGNRKEGWPVLENSEVIALIERASQLDGTDIGLARIDVTE